MDINVLLALTWTFHVHHSACHAWFARARTAGFCTCPLTQIGLVRLSSNPAFTKKAVPPMEALAMLGDITRLPEHRFWPADLPPEQAFRGAGINSHHQVTDAYLLGLAKARGGIFATLDWGVRALDPATDALEIIGGFDPGAGQSM